MHLIDITTVPSRFLIATGSVPRDEKTHPLKKVGEAGSRKVDVVALEKRGHAIEVKYFIAMLPTYWLLYTVVIG